MVNTEPVTTASLPPSAKRVALYRSLDELRAQNAGRYSALLGVRFVELSPGRLLAELDVGPTHIASNGFVYAPVLLALADTACGAAADSIRPPHVARLATIDLHASFLATTGPGLVRCEAAVRHAGRSTQVWDATVSDHRGRQLAVVRVTQLLLGDPVLAGEPDLSSTSAAQLSSGTEGTRASRSPYAGRA